MTVKTPLHDWTAAKLGVPGIQLDRPTLERYQLEKLSATVHLATADSGFYRERLGKYGKAGVGSMSELAELPFTDAWDLRRDGPRMVCVSQSQINRVVTLDTSGTVGDPKRLWFTAEDQALTVDFFQAGMSTLTKPGDRVLILLPGRRPASVGDLLAQALTGMSMTPLLYDWAGNLADASNFMQRERPDSVVGSPVQVLALARYTTGRVKLAKFPRTVLLSTDYAPGSLVQEVERLWGCRVFDHYGMTEMGLGGGVECEAHSGYHLREADLLFEVVDPNTGERLPDGCEGEVVFSTLTRRGMPLIRYRTGDLSRILPEPCTCGSSLKRLDRLSGRLDSILRLPMGGTLRLSEIAEAVFAAPGVIDYSAMVAADSHHVKLAVSVLTIGGRPNVREAVKVELERIETVRNAWVAGCLELRVDSRECDESLLPVSGKRLFRKVT